MTTSFCGVGETVITSANYMLFENLPLEDSDEELSSLIFPWNDDIEFCFWVKGGKIKELREVNGVNANKGGDVRKAMLLLQKKFPFRDGLVVMNSSSPLPFAAIPSILANTGRYPEAIRVGTIRLGEDVYPLSYVSCTGVAFVE